MLRWQGISIDRVYPLVETEAEKSDESENFKILWDFTVQCDRIIEARKPDIVFIHKMEREAFIIYIAIPGDGKVKDKEHEKVEKYQLLKDEVARVWRMRKVIVVAVVIGALGANSVNFGEYLKRNDVNVRLKVLQKTALFDTAKILVYFVWDTTPKQPTTNGTTFAEIWRSFVIP